jgi:hypothetical protein
MPRASKSAALTSHGILTPVVTGQHLAAVFITKLGKRRARMVQLRQLPNRGSARFPTAPPSIAAKNGGLPKRTTASPLSTLEISEMNKSLLALAVLGAFAGVAAAQSSVTLYGVLDVSYG